MDKRIQKSLELSLGPLLASLFIFFPHLKYFSVQYIALLSIITIFLSLKTKKLSLIALSFLTSGIVFSTGGLSSPVFFLTYFFIFTLASLNSPQIPLFYSLFYTILLTNSLDSINSVFTLISIPFIIPLAHFIGKLRQDNIKKTVQITIDEKQIRHHEKKFFLWFSLTLKQKLNTIIDLTSQLLSNPQLNYNQKQSLRVIKSNTKAILKSAASLAKDIDQNTDEK